MDYLPLRHEQLGGRLDQPAEREKGLGVGF